MHALSTSNDRMQRRIAFGELWDDALKVLKGSTSFEQIEDAIESLCRRLLPRVCEGSKLFLVSRRSQEHLVTSTRGPTGRGIADFDSSEGGSPQQEEEAQNSISLFSANVVPGAGLHVGGGGCKSISSCSRISPQNKVRREQRAGRGVEPHSRNHTGRG